MRRTCLAIVLSAAGTVSACRSVDPEKLRLVHDEVATLGSLARCSGPRSREEIARIDSGVASVQKNIDEIVR